MSAIQHSAARPRTARSHCPVLSRLLGVAGCAALLAGCYTDQAALSDQAPTPITNDYRLRHPITVREGTREVQLFVGSRRGPLTPAQRADVLALAHRWGREATGGIIIDVPAGTDNEPAAASAVPEIRSILAGAGVPADGIVARAYRPDHPGTLATLRISYPTMEATAGPCGLWPHDLGPTFDREYNENVEYWNFGCASQRNLAAMVDNPADLVQPRGETPTSTPRRTYALDKYRQGQPTGTTYPSNDSAKLSDVGK